MMQPPRRRKNENKSFRRAVYYRVFPPCGLLEGTHILYIIYMLHTRTTRVVTALQTRIQCMENLRPAV